MKKLRPFKRFCISLTTLSLLIPSLLSAQEMRIIIQSGFEENCYFKIGGKSINMGGVDQSTPTPYNNWDPLRDNVGFELWDHDTYPEKAYYELLPDPLNSENQVLLAELKGHNGKKGRAQGSFKFNYGMSYPANVIHMRFRWLIPEDWESLKEMDPHGWTDFFEIWTHDGNEADFQTHDGAGTFRMNFRFEEHEGSFRWDIIGQDRCYDGDDDRSWIYYNNDIPVPFGKWTDFEVLIIKGPDPKIHPRSQARFLVRLKPEGDSWQTLFDITTERTEHSYAPQAGYRAFQPIKNYTHYSNIDYLISKGLRPAFYFDDFDLRISEDILPEPYRYMEIPGRIEAEDADKMEGVQFNITNDIDGEMEVDSINPGDWLEYQVNTPDAGIYSLNFRLISKSQEGSFSLYSGDSLLANLDIPGSADENKWINLIDTVSLPAGNQNFKLVAQEGNWAFNWFSIEEVPIPVVEVTPANDTICSGEETGMVLKNIVDLDYGLEFEYRSAISSGDLVGNGDGTIDEKAMLKETLVNSSGVYSSVEYEITPWALKQNGERAYAGKKKKFKIWVEPESEASSAHLYDTIHSGDKTAILVNSETIATNGIIITYSSTTGSDEIEGNGSGLLNPGQRIIETLINNKSSPDYVIYEIVPYTLDINEQPACPGSALLDTIWIRAGKGVSVQKTNTLIEGIHPNPAFDIARLSSPASWELYSITGEKLLTGEDREIDISGLHPGIYFIKTPRHTFRLLKK